jgi:tol-pal system protein YbgF
MTRISLFAVALMASVASFTPAQAQDANNRIDLLEEQIRMLTGKVEELNFTVKQLQGQVRKQTGAAPAAVAAPKKQAIVLGGTETIEAQPLAAPKPKQTAAAEEPDPLYGEEDAGEVKIFDPPKEKVAVAQDAVVEQPAVEQDAAQTGIEQVSLEPETPETLYKRSDEALLRRQFPEAEQGFRDFLSKYPDHNLAGSAQFWLGETFYVQGDYRTAAQNFLTGYQKFPKSRRAADSLLKLGLSLNKLGQKSQGCAALANVASEFPKSVEAKKRAQTEITRAGC